MTSFYGPIKSYDIHTYWDNNNERQRKEAYALRELIQKEFASELENGDIRLFKMWEEPIGPHPVAMFEIDFKTPEIFAKVVPFYQLNHGSLSVLVHPRSGNDLLDHTKNAIWIGHKVRLNTDALE